MSIKKVRKAKIKSVADESRLYDYNRYNYNFTFLEAQFQFEKGRLMLHCF